MLGAILAFKYAKWALAMDASEAPRECPVNTTGRVAFACKILPLHENNSKIIITFTTLICLDSLKRKRSILKCLKNLEIDSSKNLKTNQHIFLQWSP